MKKNNSFKIRSLTFIISTMATFAAFAVPSTFDGDKPTVTYSSTYSQAFNTTEGWNDVKFYDQWSTVDNRVFTSADIVDGYLAYKWSPKRILYSNHTYSTPYVFQTNLNYSRGSARGGMVIRYLQSYGLDNQLQETGKLGLFNRAGIAFFPKDADNLYIQFSGTEALGNTLQTRITVPKTSAITSYLTATNTLRIEDFGATIYVYMNGAPLVRIELGGLTSGVYTSGEVFDASLASLGTFTGMVVPTTGIISVAQRDAALSLYDVLVQSNVPSKPSSFAIDKPTPTMTTTYSQAYNTTAGWDGTAFYNQWETLNATCFDATDIANDYLKFVWPGKIIMCSNNVYNCHNGDSYSVETNTEYEGTYTRGGLVLRVPATIVLNEIQEVINTAALFNRTGIAFYPNDKFTHYSVQFTGKKIGAAVATYQSKINVPKPSGSDLKAKNKIRVDDFGSVIYMYFNDQPYLRIDLGGLEGDIYTTAKVYDANMNVQGNSNGMSIPANGKIAFGARATTLKLYDVSIKQVDFSTAMNNKKATEKVYQAGSKIVVEMNNKYQTIRILDLQGRCMEELNATNATKVISSKSYTNGLYLVKAVGISGESTNKVLIK